MEEGEKEEETRRDDGRYSLESDRPKIFRLIISRQFTVGSPRAGERSVRETESRAVCVRAARERGV